MLVNIPHRENIIMVLKTSKTTSKTTNQPINQSTNQPINQSTNQPFNHSNMQLRLSATACEVAPVGWTVGP
jgi:hypothetical protein